MFNFDFYRHINLTPFEKKNLQELEKLQKIEWFVEVHKLSEGGSFGELALINDKPRAATLTCLSDCIFAVIGRADYQKFLERLE